MARVNRRFFSKNEELATKAYADSAFTAARTYTDNALVTAKSYAEDMRDEAKAYTDNLAEAIGENFIRATDTMPEPVEDLENQMIQYVGSSNSDYTTGHIYQCVYDSYNNYYYWRDISVGEGSSLPNPSQHNEGQIVQYTGPTEEGLVNGYFYECVYDSTRDDYIWKQIKVQPGEELDYITNYEIDEMFGDVSGATIRFKYLPEVFSYWTANHAIGFNVENIVFDPEYWDINIIDEWETQYVPKTSDVLNIIFSYEGIEVNPNDVCVYYFTQDDENYFYGLSWNDGDLQEIFNQTNNTYRNVAVHIQMAAGVLTINDELNFAYDNTFLYGDTLDGSVYPQLRINRDDLIYVTTEGEGEDTRDIYEMVGDNDSDAYWYPYDKADMDSRFYNGAFPMIVIDDNVIYNTEGEWNSGENYGYTTYVVPEHETLPDYLSDYMQWGEVEDQETGNWKLMFVFGKNWNRM